MKTILITLMALVAFPALAAEQQECAYKTVMVCRSKAKPAPKKVVKKVKKPREVIRMPDVHIVVEAPKKEVVVVEKRTEVVEDEFLLFGPRLAVGLGARDPAPEALLGLRAHIPSLHLGAEIYTAFDFGFGLQALVYPIQGRLVNWHLNAGVLLVGDDEISAPDISRNWDLTIGTGVEVKLWRLEGGRHISLTGDYRWAIPSPVFITQNDSPVFNGDQQVYGPDGRYLDTKAVLGNSLTGGHFLVGALLQF